jgi:hypothetical protein
VSPYLKILLQSEFSEGTVKRAKRRRTTPPISTSSNGDATMEPDGTALDDSDDEADEVVLASGLAALDSRDTDELEYREIKITKTAYSTYRALLTYLNTSYITFAPLASSFLPSTTPTRKDRLASHLAREPSLSLPVSPKSLCRLAHLLEIPSVQKPALDDLKSQLTVDNIAAELSGDVSHLYEDVRSVELELAIKHWQEVKKSKRMVEIFKEAKTDGVPYPGEVMADLVPRV